MNCLHCRDGLVASKETCEATDIEVKVVSVERDCGHDNFEECYGVVPSYASPNYESEITGF
jgi:hypothetical protein